jgi:catechol 2,3-dioxygenase-like lactoylglutathione lyase family enzyme
MITNSNIHGVFVLDQDEALDFYVNKLGLEVAADIDMGFMRWLTVRAPGDENHEILLELPGGPAYDDGTAAQIRELVSKGATGFSSGFVVDDARKTYEALVEKGVEVSEEPTDRFYGVDFGLRDPFGNHIRVVEPKPFDPAAVGEEAKAEQYS